MGCQVYAAQARCLLFKHKSTTPQQFSKKKILEKDFFFQNWRKVGLETTQQNGFCSLQISIKRTQEDSSQSSKVRGIRHNPTLVPLEGISEKHSPRSNPLIPKVTIRWRVYIHPLWLLGKKKKHCGAGSKRCGSGGSAMNFSYSLRKRPNKVALARSKVKYKRKVTKEANWAWIKKMSLKNV